MRTTAGSDGPRGGPSPSPPDTEARSERSGRTIALMLESDGPGGAEQMLLNLASEYRDRGHAVVPVGPVVGEGWLPRRFRDRGFEPESYRLQHPFDPRCLVDLIEIIRRRGVDQVHSHEFSMAVFGAAAARLTRRPHVITMHGSRYYAGRWRRRAALRWAFRASDRVAAVSSASRDDLAETLGLSPTEIDVVPNGVPSPAGSPARIRAELALEEDEPLILSVGNLYRVKGHDVLVRALSRVADLRPDLAWRAAVAGRGQEEERLRTLAVDGGISHRIHFLGFRDDVGDLLAACRIFTLPSRSESLPLALLEAMHAAAAVVATAVGGVPEIVTSEREALLVPPGDEEALGDALIRVLEDPRLRARLASGARRRAKSGFSVQSMADRYEELYAWRPATVGGAG